MERPALSVEEARLQPGEPGWRPKRAPFNCSICSHPSRSDAELMLAAGARVRAVSDKLNLPYNALHRHWKHHVSDNQKRLLAIGDHEAVKFGARIRDEGVSVLDHLRMARATIYHALDIAIAANDVHRQTQLIAQLHRNAEIVGRVTGELATSPLVQFNSTRNVLINSPQYGQLTATILGALKDHPQARTAVVKALRAMEADIAGTEAKLIDVKAKENDAAA